MKAGKVLQSIKDAFKAKRLNADFHLTEHSWHGIELVRDADLDTYDGVIAAGGDGTLFEVINGYRQNSSENKPPIGILPIGTGNSFAIDLDLRSYEWEKAIDLIALGRTRQVDIARFTTEGKEYYYMNILGLGFVSDVNATSKHFKLFGNSAYTIGVLWQLALMKTYSLDIDMDGKRLTRENFFVEISNTRYTGSTFLMAPEAQIDDGYLDVVLLNKASRLRVLKLFPTIFKGTHVNEKEVETFKAKKIIIHTSRPQSLTPDGEQMGSTPLEVECLHRAVEVFY